LPAFFCRSPRPAATVAFSPIFPLFDKRFELKGSEIVMPGVWKKSLALLGLLLALGAPAQAQTVPDWQKKWDETLAAAKAEGKLVVIGQPSPAMRNEIVPAFSRKYGIPVD
jgi:hypothetical protein